MPTTRIGNTKAVILCLLLTAGLVAADACKAKRTEQTQESILKDMVAKATGGQAQVDLKKGEIRVKTAEGDAVITSGGGIWPANMPEEIPQFKAGSIIQSTNQQQGGQNGWMVIFQGVEEEAVGAYVEDLKNNGWNVDMSTDSPGGKMIQCTVEKYLIDLAYATEPKTLTVAEKTQK